MLARFGLFVIATILQVLLCVQANATPVFVGPTGYLSTGDIPTSRSVTTTNTGPVYDDGIGGLVNGLDFLVPDPGDRTHYVGRRTVTHREDPRPGGAAVIDSYVEWDFYRRPH